MNNKSLINKKAILISLLALITIFQLPVTALAQGLNLAPDCNPALPPNATPEQIQKLVKPGDSTSPCNISAFLTWIRKLINFLLTIAIPIGVIFVVWGGFVIMTAGGSEDRVKKGKQIITAAVIGLAISFGAWLIINALNFFLVGEFQFK